MAAALFGSGCRPCSPSPTHWFCPSPPSEWQALAPWGAGRIWQHDPPDNCRRQSAGPGDEPPLPWRSWAWGPVRQPGRRGALAGEHRPARNHHHPRRCRLSGGSGIVRNTPTTRPPGKVRPIYVRMGIIHEVAFGLETAVHHRRSPGRNPGSLVWLTNQSIKKRRDELIFIQSASDHFLKSVDHVAEGSRVVALLQRS